VIGASGSGKTTLLRLVAGLEVPDAGVVSVEGRVVASPRRWVHPEDREVGMVFQDFALFPHLEVRENVAYGLRRLSRGDREARVRELLAAVGLEAYAGRYPHQLSGGQQQRVALARALAPEPRALLLDEPFSNLDLPLKAELARDLGRLLARRRTPALLVVHDAEDVMALADRVAVLREGRIVQLGSPDRVLRAPVDDYVAGFFARLYRPEERPAPSPPRNPRP